MGAPAADHPVLDDEGRQDAAPVVTGEGGRLLITEPVAGGTSAELSGPPRLAWQVARGSMLTVFSGMGTAVFLGGWHGPLLPGWAWIGLKTLAVMLVVIGLGQVLGRVPAERAMAVLWTIALPLAFVGLLLAGIEALP